MALRREKGGKFRGGWGCGPLGDPSKPQATLSPRSQSLPEARHLPRFREDNIMAVGDEAITLTITMFQQRPKKPEIRDVGTTELPWVVWCRQQPREFATINFTNKDQAGGAG